jgi:hypothetical protein
LLGGGELRPGNSPSFCERIEPEDIGIVGGDRRPVPGLRRKELASASAGFRPASSSMR